MMADQMVAALERYQLRDVIGVGAGAGALLLIHLAMAASDKFLGITVIDPPVRSLSFKEQSERKLVPWHLEKKGFGSRAEKFLLRHLFGNHGNQKNNSTAIERIMADIKEHQNLYNLSLYMKSFMGRSSIMKKIKTQLQCNVLVITGKKSPYKKDAYLMHRTLSNNKNNSSSSNNSNSPNNKSSLLLLNDVTNPFFEDGDKCGEGMLLFIQGLGLAPTLRTRMATRAQTSRMRSNHQLVYQAG